VVRRRSPARRRSSVGGTPYYSIPDFTAEYPFDTTRTIISLLFNGAFHRYPRIRWHFAHGGGTVAMLRFRLTALTARAKQVGGLLGLPAGSSVLTEDSANRALRRAFFDTALIPERPALEAVSAMAGVNSIVFGSDWPFAGLLYGPSGDPQPGLSTVFSNEERHRIDRRNARAQFARLRSAVPRR
jgi:predicted TIM-barrel fold metal-dependent hydrolase